MKAAIGLGAVGLVMVAAGVMHANAAGTAPTKVAYVDLQRTLQETQIGQKAKSNLELEKTAKQNQVNQKKDDLKKEADDFDKQRVVMKPDAVQAKQDELQQKYAELQDLFMQLQQDLAKKEAALTQDVFKAAQPIIQSIAQRDGYTIVLEKNESAILWADTTFDITAEVDKRLDSGN
jgi:outer membrane protein